MNDNRKQIIADGERDAGQSNRELVSLRSRIEKLESEIAYLRGLINGVDELEPFHTLTAEQAQVLGQLGDDHDMCLDIINNPARESTLKFLVAVGYIDVANLATETITPIGRAVLAAYKLSISRG